MLLFRHRDAAAQRVGGFLMDAPQGFGAQRRGAIGELRRAFEVFARLVLVALAQARRHFVAEGAEDGDEQRLQAFVRWIGRETRRSCCRRRCRPSAPVSLRADNCASPEVTHCCAGDSGGGASMRSTGSAGIGRKAAWQRFDAEEIVHRRFVLRRHADHRRAQQAAADQQRLGQHAHATPEHRAVGQHRVDGQAAALDAVERFEHLLRTAEPVRRRLGHRAVDEALPLHQFGGQPRNRILGVHHRHRQGIGRVVRQRAGEHFPGEHADAVQVGAAVDFFAARLFRRHVGGAADGEARHRQARVDALAQRDAEVGELRTLGVVEQDVLGLDVAVHDAAHVRVVERFEQRAQGRDDPGLVVRDAVLARDALAEVATAQIRHRVIGQAVLGAADLVDADDVRDGRGGRSCALRFRSDGG
jgi:hypothetical protein